MLCFDGEARRNHLEKDPMTPFGRTGLAGQFSLALRPRLRLLQPIMLTLSLLVLLPGVGAAQATAPSRSQDHVFLLRGAFNIFSLGMDEIADKLRRQGVNTTVSNYLAWSSLADEAAAEYKSGRVRTIILVGHSSGATAVTEMAARLGQLGVPVKLAIGFDPTSRMTASGHVDRYINYYIPHGMGNAVDRGRQFSGVVQNIDVEKDSAISHFNIDKNRALQEQVLREIRAAL
jgi:pimeloyl-ACP methyl ester carboxylesterase